jgi:Ca-activated chloride channel family protein
MTFASPGWLWALGLVPLTLIAYVWARRRRGARYAIRFPAVGTLREAVQASPAWGRHIPAVLAVAAAGLLVLALARPKVSYSAPVRNASIMLVIDHSGSMASNDVAPSRLAAVKAAANRLIDKLPATVRVGVIGFGSTPDRIQAPVSDHAAARALIDAQIANGGTDTGGALELALQLLHASSAHHPPSVIVLLSDGAANLGPDPVTVARVAARDHIPIDTVALGTPDGTIPSPLPFQAPIPVPPDPQLMRQIAQASGGRAFNAQDAGTLSSIYSHLGSHLGSVTRRREITFAFVIGGLVALAAAGIFSVRWSERVPA